MVAKTHADMLKKPIASSHQGLSPSEFSQLSATFICSLDETFRPAGSPLRLWPLSDNRDVFLRRFWDAMAADAGPKAIAFQPDELSVQIMREGDCLMGLMLLPSQLGSVGFSTAVWLFGPVEADAADPYAAANARFFAMAENRGSDSEARLYEVVDGGLAERGILATANIELFLHTVVERYVTGQAVATVRSGDPEMAEAMERAASLIPYFIDILENYPSVVDYSVKIRIAEGDEVEYFWLENTQWETGSFRGTLGNDPTRVTSVAYGQEMTATPDEICDWYYLWDGKMRGNYTLRAGLPYMDPTQAAKLSAILDDE